jgi:hypothetical protein
MLVIVPDCLANAINAKLDAALVHAPPEALACRRHLYCQLLTYFNEHGIIPEFTVVRGVGGASR